VPILPSVFVKCKLYRHCRNCKFQIPDGPVDGYISTGRALLTGSVAEAASGIDESLKQFLINRIRVDKLTKLVQGDSLILKFGLMLLKMLGRKRASDISARMRELARLLCRLQSDESVTEPVLSSFLTGHMFDKVMDAVEKEGRPSTEAGGRRVFEKPAFVIKIGNSLLNCVSSSMVWPCVRETVLA
jgi:hypothetical protein